MISEATPRHPAIDLLSRYRAVFGAAWAARHQLAGPARLADEAAFLPAALSLQDTPVHPAPRRLALALMALFLIALAAPRAGVTIVTPGYSITPPAAQLALLQQSDDALKQSVYGALVLQTRLKPYLDSIKLTIDENGIGFEAAAPVGNSIAIKKIAVRARWVGDGGQKRPLVRGTRPSTRRQSSRSRRVPPDTALSHLTARSNTGEAAGDRVFAESDAERHQ